jgi:hypothetical protein
MSRSLPLTQDAMQTYLRLLRYLKPHIGMFLFGVLGMALFAAPRRRGRGSSSSSSTAPSSTRTRR